MGRVYIEAIASSVRTKEPDHRSGWRARGVVRETGQIEAVVTARSEENRS